MDNETVAIVCYTPTMVISGGVWHGDHFLYFALPTFILQLALIIIITRCLLFLLQPFHQPRVISEILGGLLLGPSVLGQSKKFADTIFPQRSVIVLETAANMGAIFFLFLLGVGMDLSVIKNSSKKAFCIATAGTILPFVFSTSFSFLLHSGATKQAGFIIFLGIALSVTAFPVVARILAELKLINTELGKIAMPSALISDIIAWVLLAVGIALAEMKSSSFASLWVILSCTAYVLFCIFVVRPAILWMVRRTPEGETFNEFFILLILTGVLVSAFITDAIGMHAIFGAFFFGLIIPNDLLGATLTENLEDFISGILLPVFFANSGLKTDLGSIGTASTWGLLFLAIIIACTGKVIGTLIVYIFYQMPMVEGLSLGLLMNAKGLVEMIILNVGRDHQVLDDKAFSIMIIISVVMTSMITPIVAKIYKPGMSFTPYRRRTIEFPTRDVEMRILVYIHNSRSVPTIINLLDISHPTKQSPLCVYVIHLVELTGRESGMLIVHNRHRSRRQAINQTEIQCDHIINAFENYEHHAGCVSVHSQTAISPYSSMHEDICTLATDRRVAFIIIPFHKHQTVDGAMEVTNPAFRTVNQNVLANAPCSVGILVDRGLSGSNNLSGSIHSTGTLVANHVTILFFGGSDDREALAYASRMSTHPGTKLRVVRFIPGEDAEKPTVQPNDGLSKHVLETQKLLDEQSMKRFRIANANDESVIYTEEVVNNGDETVAAIRSMGKDHDLIIVGRDQGTLSSLTAGLTEWSECPELGAIGDLLASSDFAATFSVLVVQQYVGLEPQREVLENF